MSRPRPTVDRLFGRIIDVVDIGGWSERSLPLATVLLTPWALFQGASEEVIARAKEDGDEDILTEGGNALEVGLEKRLDLVMARRGFC